MPERGSLDNRLRRTSWVTFWSIGMVVLLAVVFLVVVGLVYRPHLDRLVNGGRAVGDAHTAMLDQETGARGYLLTHDPAFLDPYDRGVQELEAANAEADSRLLGERLAPQLVRTQLSERSWSADWATRALELGRTGSPIPDGFVNEGKQLFDAYRADQTALDSAVSQRRRRVFNQMFTVLGLGGVLNLALAMALLFVTRRQAKGLRNAVQPPIAALLAEFEAVRAGRFDPPDPVDGPTEFVRLSEGLADAVRALAAARQEASTNQEALAERARELAVVLRLTREVSGSLNLRYVLRGVVAAAQALEPGGRVVLWGVDESGVMLEPLADSQGPDLNPLGLEGVALGQGSVGTAARFGRPVKEPAGSGAGGRDDVEAIPMVVGARVIGVLELHRPVDAETSASRDEVLEMLTGHAATAIEAARLHHATETLTVTDTLTALANRRRFEGDLQAEVARSVRYERPLAFAMFDVDHFKRYNDNQGHQGGDHALQEVARVVAAAVRASDSVYRYGGEEFAILMPETSGEDAHHLAQRLCDTVARHFRDPLWPRPITISVGTSAIPTSASDCDSLVAAADAALYEAKDRGRNQAVAAPSAAAPEESGSTVPHR